MGIALNNTCRHGQDKDDCYVCELLRELATLRAHLTRAIDFIKKAGHLPGCPAGTDSCQFSVGEHAMKCGAIKGAWWHNRGHVHFGHDFQPGPCGCGHDEVVREGEG